MTKPKPIDTKNMAEEARTSKLKETYRLLEKNQTYRIGVGARANLPETSSFFVEVVLNLAAENGEVDVARLEKILAFLKAIKARGYSLTFEDGNCISCETTAAVENPSEEYFALKTMMKTTLLDSP